MCCKNICLCPGCYKSSLVNDMNLCVFSFFSLINLSSFWNHNKGRCRGMNIILSDFLFLQVERNSNFMIFFLHPRLFVVVCWGSSNASVLIVPQVFVMYYGGFYCAMACVHVCMNISLMELKGGVSLTISLKFMIFLFHSSMWKMDLKRWEGIQHVRGMEIGFQFIKKREVGKRRGRRNFFARVACLHIALSTIL